MSEFTETIKVVVQSVFNSDGFDKLERRMANLMNTRDNLEKQFNRGIGMKNIKSEIEQVEDKFKEAGLQIETFKDDVDDIRIRNDKGQFAGVESFSNSIDEMFEAEDGEQMANRIVNSSQIEENVDAAKNQLNELGFAFTDIETGKPVDIGEVVDRTADAANRLDKFGGFDQQNMMASILPEERGMDMPGMRIPRTLGDSLQNFSLPSPDQSLRDDLASTLTTGASGQIDGEKINIPSLNARSLAVLSAEMSQLGEASQIASTDLQRLVRNRLPEMDQGMRQAASSTRGLQMRLLGLQFTMLTVAFIFGGVMASALGAVGAFQILGNTLKFLFLPTALDLLDPLLALQDEVFNLDEETRNFIGRLFAAISAGSIAIGIFAALAQPLVGLAGVLMNLGGKLGIIKAIGKNLLFLFTLGRGGGGKAAGMVTKVKNLFSALRGGGILTKFIGKIRTVLSVVGRLAVPIMIVVGVLIALFTIFDRFPGITNAVVSAVAGAFGFLFDFLKAGFKIVAVIMKGFVNIIEGLTTFLVAALVGDTKKMKKGLQENLKGVSQILVEPFEIAINALMTDIVPGIFDVIHDMITGMVDMLTDNDSIVGEAFINLLPRFLRGPARNAMGMIGGGIESTVDSMVAGIDDVGHGFEKIDVNLGKDFKKESTRSKAKKEDSNNGFTVENLNTSLNLQQRQGDSALETGRKHGRGLRQGLVNKRSNFSTGT